VREQSGFLIDPDGIYLIAPEGLTEGKAVGRARERNLIVMADPTMQAAMHPADYAAKRHIGVTVGRRTLLQVQAEVEDRLNVLVERLTAASAKRRPAIREEAVKVMRKAWARVYTAGLRSGGLEDLGSTLTAEDQQFLKGAVSHEMRYLNRFLDTVEEGGGRMPYPQRVGLYVKTLSSFYENARLIALPANSTIRWIGPADKDTCPSCRYLFESGPYTKRNLPCVPRSGSTICLSNCRDRLLIRRVTPQEALEVAHGGRTRQQHTRTLERIKRTGAYQGRTA
jgi:hypothetical protein